MPTFCGSDVSASQASISKFHTGFHGAPIGSHPLVSQAIKAVFRLRPPIPKYNSTFNVLPVLQYISGLEPLDDLPLKLLTYKTFFLMSHCSLSRVNSVSRLGPDVKRGQVNDD